MSANLTGACVMYVLFVSTCCLGCSSCRVHAANGNVTMACHAAYRATIITQLRSVPCEKDGHDRTMHHQPLCETCTHGKLHRHHAAEMPAPHLLPKHARFKLTQTDRTPTNSICSARKGCYNHPAWSTQVKVTKFVQPPASCAGRGMPQKSCCC